jgi:hypothetical protein
MSYSNIINNSLNDYNNGLFWYHYVNIDLINFSFIKNNENGHRVLFENVI